VRQAFVAVVAIALAAACAPTPLPKPGSYHGSDADVGVTRIAHGGAVIEIAGERFIIDPWLHSGLVVRQQEPLGLHPDTLPPASAVLLTQERGDRFDEKALAILARTTSRAVAPPAVGDALRAVGFRDVVPLAWWAHTEVDGVRVTAVPASPGAQHNGYVLARHGTVVYAAGDTREDVPFGDVVRTFDHVDVALLPIGGRRVSGFRTAMGPIEAAAAARALGANRVVPTGYGAYGVFPALTFAHDAVRRFRDAALHAGLRPEQIVVLEPGESWHYYR
jgi:L-ascorbate metabolism protein UlaG (beta-lactamase superfamily)